MRAGIFALSFFLSGICFAAGDAPFPPAPTQHISDQAHVLDAPTFSALDSILEEHERTTTEQFVVAIFDSLGDGEVADRTNRIFSAWKIGKKGKDNGVLLALYWKEHKMRVEVGYGLEHLLTDAKSKTILSEVIAPELRGGTPGRALSLGVLEILKTIESPLIANGRALQILEGGGFRHSSRARVVHRSPLGSWIWLVVGILVFAAVARSLSAREAHFTNKGWYRPSPFGARPYGRTSGDEGFWGFLLGLLISLLNNGGGGGGVGSFRAVGGG
ncbi:TPM domain-containing protein [Bdellovibrionota bacterium FG-2]